MNTAQQLLHIIGVASGVSDKKQAHGCKNESSRKAGPGRYHANGDGTKTDKQKRAGAFGRGLRNWINRTQAARYA